MTGCQVSELQCPRAGGALGRPITVYLAVSSPLSSPCWWSPVGAFPPCGVSAVGSATRRISHDVAFVVASRIEPCVAVANGLAPFGPLLIGFAD